MEEQRVHSVPTCGVFGGSNTWTEEAKVELLSLLLLLLWWFFKGSSSLLDEPMS